ncbi:hypothetical protein [Fodinicola feengrottensis]|nr:hypothetical protein [Fodinicola feengrottensis]
MITGTFSPACAASDGRTISMATRSGLPSPSLSRLVSTQMLSRIALAYE